LRRTAPVFALRGVIKILGMKVYFFVWIAWSMFWSQMNILDICTDSRFVATANHILGKEPLYDELWNTAWQQSVLGHAPTPNLRLCILMSWVLSIVQLILPLLRTLRRCDLSSTSMLKVETWASPAIFGGDVLTNASVLFGLGEACGFMSVQHSTIPWALQFSQTRSTTGAPNGVITSLSGSVDVIWDRVFYSLLLENAVQLNLQSTFYALQMAAQKITKEDQMHVEVLQSLSVTILGLLLKVAEAYEFCKLLRASDEIAARVDISAYAKTLNAKTQRKGRIVCVGYFLLLTSVAYAVVTCLMAHWCEQSTWTIRGCMTVIP